jgi:hypothetical protein
MSKELDELRDRVEAMEREKEKNISYWDGVKDSLKRMFWVCGIAWTSIAFLVNCFADYAYRHIPVVKNVIDAIIGSKNG